MIEEFIAAYPILEYELFHNTVWQYGVALAVFIGVSVVLRSVLGVFLSHLKRIAGRTPTQFDTLLIERLRSISWPFYAAFSFWGAARVLTLPDSILRALDILILIVVVYYAVRVAQQILVFFFETAAKKRLSEDAHFDPSAIRLLSRGLQGALWAVAILLILQNLGYNITALVAGFGIGGLAIAFALQNVLSDVFAAFSIYLDRPFQTGDFIIVGDDMGVVKNIGIKSTRIQSLWGEEITLPNKDLTEAHVRNFKRAISFRKEFRFAVPYGTPHEKLLRVPEIVKDIAERIELIQLDRAHLKEFGEAGLVFEVMYHAKTGDFNIYMDAQQQLILALYERLLAEGFTISYPTQTLFVHSPK